MYYTGIGSRETPDYVLHLMVRLGESMAKYGAILRTGGARGADQAFMRGCDNVGGKKNVYIPWAGFEGLFDGTGGAIIPSFDNKLLSIAETFHPAWQFLSYGAQKLHARNVPQVLGSTLNEPSALVICYTKNGSGSGGTGQAIRIARAYDIPVYDLGNAETLIDIEWYLNGILGQSRPRSIQ